MSFENSPFRGARVGKAKAEKGWLSAKEFDALGKQEFQDYRNAQGHFKPSSINISNIIRNSFSNEPMRQPSGNLNHAPQINLRTALVIILVTYVIYKLMF